MSLVDKELRDILLKGGYVDPKDFEEAVKQSIKSGTTALNYMLAHNVVSRDVLGQAIAEYYKVPYADLNTIIPDRDQILRLPEEVARAYHAILFKEDKEGVTIATDDPTRKGLIDQVKKLFPAQKVYLAYSLTEDIANLFVHYRKALATRFSQIIEESAQVAPEVVEEVVKDAIGFKASDIHIEPQGEEVLIRFRVDGVLQEAGRIPRQHYESILNRIKVQANLRIDQHSAVQDGSIRYKNEDKEVDLRVSIAPTLEGEKVVLRLLAQHTGGYSTGELGLSPQDQMILEEAARKPFGMIMTTGPTGSGKTTTLHALVRMLNSPEVNITTIEDPVEYRVKGVNQMQVDHQTDLTFARGLRSIVRQDPDIILVGEIRDQETAEIAVNAALTGHLMLSTFHANDAATSIPRLLDMEIEPFLLSSTLELVIAQRLVRRICGSCIQSKPLDAQDLVSAPEVTVKYIGNQKFNVYKGKGCASCGDTGYNGRTAIFELIKITPEMKDLILTNPSTSEVWNLAREQGTRSMFEDGLEKVKSGVTTIQELIRVASPPDERRGDTEKTQA